MRRVTFASAWRGEDPGRGLLLTVAAATPVWISDELFLRLGSLVTEASAVEALDEEEVALTSGTAAGATLQEGMWKTCDIHVSHTGEGTGNVIYKVQQSLDGGTNWVDMAFVDAASGPNSYVGSKTVTAAGTWLFRVTTHVPLLRVFVTNNQDAAVVVTATYALGE